MPDTTVESAKTIESADSSLKKATTSEAAREALSGLATSSDPTQRAQEVSRATNVLVHNGDLPQVLLVFDGSTSLSKLGYGDDKINKNDPAELAALKQAAETGAFTDKDGQVVRLSTEEWIAARALYQNFDAIESSAETGAGDGLISTNDIQHAATDPTAQSDLGTRYAELESAVMAFPGLADGSVDPAAFSKIFGKDSVTKGDIASLISSPQFDSLSPLQQRGVLALYSQYDNIAGKDGDAGSVNQNDLWMAAGEAGINYGANQGEMAAAQADVDAFEEASQPQAPVAGDTVDSIVRDLAKPLPSGTTAFDYLDQADGTRDGTISKDQVQALAYDNSLGLMDPKLAASLKALESNWERLSGGKDTVSITDLAAQSTSYKGDATTDAIKAHAAQASAPLNDEEIDSAMKAIYQPNPGSDRSVFYLLTDGQEGRPEDRKGFTRADIDRTLAAYKSVYGENSPEYLEAQAGLGKVRTDFDKYDTDGNGSISYTELASISGNPMTIGQLQESYGPADPQKLSGLLSTGGNYEHLSGQKNLTQDELTNAIAKLPDGSPEKATLQYVLQHYDQLKTADGDDKHLTWNDITSFAASGVEDASSSNDNGNSGGDSNHDGSHQIPLKPGQEVDICTGKGKVNSDGTISYTIGTWTDSNPETPETLADSVLTLWGIEAPYTDGMRQQVLQIINDANPGVDVSQSATFTTGTMIVIPAELPAAENDGDSDT